MKIAIFTDTFFPQVNGVANVAYASAASLSKLGHDVIVFAPTSKSNKQKISTSERFQTVFLSSLPSFIYPGERVVFPFGITAFLKLKKFNPDIIHVHTPFGAGWQAFFASKILGIQLVSTHHTFFDHYLKHVNLDFDFTKKISWKYTVGYYNRSNIVLSPTKSLSTELVEHGLYKPIKILVNPIDTDLFSPMTPIQKDLVKKEMGILGKSLVYMGRVSYEKSIDIVVQAFSLLLKIEPDTTLVIIGDGPEKIVLKKLCVDLGIAHKVVFTGMLRGEELARVLAAQDIFVTASKSENMPLSILEAEACGLPIVAVGEKGILEIVTDGVNGLLSPADDTLSMCNNMVKIIQNPDMWAKMSVASQKNALMHSHKKVTEELEKIYSSII